MLDSTTRVFSSTGIYFIFPFSFFIRCISFSWVSAKYFFLIGNPLENLRDSMKHLVFFVLDKS